MVLVFIFSSPEPDMYFQTYLTLAKVIALSKKDYFISTSETNLYFGRDTLQLMWYINSLCHIIFSKDKKTIKWKLHLVYDSMSWLYIAKA